MSQLSRSHLAFDAYEGLRWELSQAQERVEAVDKAHPFYKEAYTVCSLLDTILHDCGHLKPELDYAFFVGFAPPEGAPYESLWAETFRYFKRCVACPSAPGMYRVEFR